MEASRLSRHYVTESGDPLHPLLTALTAGFDRVARGGLSHSPDPWLDTLAFSGTTAGAATLSGESFQAQHGPRSLVVMFPGSTFREIPDAPVWESHYLVLWGPLADAWVHAVNRSGTATALQPAPGVILDGLEKACRLVMEQSARWQWRFLHQLSAVLDYAQEQLAPEPGGAASLAAQAEALMARHLAAPLALADLARALNVSPSTLSHTFRQQTGLSPALAHRRRRVAAARQLLASGVSVAETARQLGFANAFHFSRLFRQMEGLPPREFARATAHEPLRTAVQTTVQSPKSKVSDPGPGDRRLESTVSLPHPHAQEIGEV